MATHVAVLPSGTFLSLVVENIQCLHASELAIGLPSGRFLRLPHPRTELVALFLPYQPEGSTRDGILEVQAVAPTNARSWFIGQEVVADGKLLVMTPIDPAFLLIPILQYHENTSQRMFRPADEIFEDAATNLEQVSAANKDVSLHISKEDILYFTSMDCCRKALRRVCDVKDIAEDITVYRFSSEKVVEYLRTKIERLSTPEAADISRTVVRSLAKDGLLEDGKEELLQVGRIRAACDLVGQYINPSMRSLLAASYDFTALDSYFKSIEVEELVEKPVKRKPAPTTVEKKRKPATSQGVEKLKKAKTGGMAKLSTFFAKKVLE
ncbi:ribonuclease H2, subunit B [Mycena pura]|uniref:Ribonuclease H2 subunit B n=1 Tax=Mycena pura TaxID=153505 RepID=A0AAD6VMY3_9AGAR|nr:ribonuclease H2, subunit B [Mycena pura]